MRLKSLLTLVAAAAVAAGSAVAPASADYPEQPIHVVVPWKAGGGTDSIARGYQTALEQAAGESVVIDNISGARGATGTMRVLESDADGHTVLLNGSTDITAALTFKELPFSLDDFAYIGGFYTSPTWILSHKDRGISTLQDFFDAAEANPGEVTLGTAGSTQLLMAHAIKGATGLDFRIVPFSGGADLKKAMIGNDVHAGIFHAPVMLNEVKAGMIDVIGTGAPLDNLVYEEARDAPTLKDHDIPLEFKITRGLYVPKDTPQEVVDKLRTLAEEAAKSEAFAKFGESYGFQPVWVPGDEYEQQLRDELATFQDISEQYIE